MLYVGQVLEKVYSTIFPIVSPAQSEAIMKLNANMSFKIIFVAATQSEFRNDQMNVSEI